MTASLITPPQEVFYDSNGTPLDAGFLYIGELNQNPETNPIQVYWDVNLTQPAAQPIRTVNGYPSNNSTRAAIYAATSDYSIVTRNWRGQLIASALAPVRHPIPTGALKTPYDYGATPGNEMSEDNSPYVQALFDAFAASFDIASRAYGIIPNFAGVKFRCDDEIWIGGVRDPGGMIFGGGGGIYSNAAGKIALNGALCNSLFIHDFEIWGDATNTPLMGLYLGKALLSGAYPDSRGHRVHGLQCRGYYTMTSYLQFASETSSLINCFFQNRSRSLTAVAYMNVGHRAIADKYGSLSSANCTFPTTGAGAQSNLGHELAGVTIERSADVTLTITGITKANPGVVTVSAGTLAGANFSNGDKVRFTNVTGMTELRTGIYTIANLNTAADTFEISGVDTTGFGTFTGGSVWSATGPAAVWNGSHLVNAKTLYTLAYSEINTVIDMSEGAALREFHMNVQPENGPDHMFELVAPSAGTAISQGVYISDMNSNQAIGVSAFKYSGTGNITINGGHLKITNLFSSASAKLFDDPANLSLSQMEIAVPVQSLLNAESEYAVYAVEETAFDRTPRTVDYRSLSFGSSPRFAPIDPRGEGLSVDGADDGAADGPYLSLRRTSASPAAADLLAYIRFEGKDSAGFDTVYGRIRGRINDPTNGSEDGQIDLLVLQNGVEVVAGFIRGDGLFSKGLPVQAIVTATTAQLEDNTNAINTTSKFIGKRVFNTTTGKPVYATGATAVAVWNDATGTTAHTPV